MRGVIPPTDKVCVRHDAEKTNRPEEVKATNRHSSPASQAVADASTKSQASSEAANQEPGNHTS